MSTNEKTKNPYSYRSIKSTSSDTANSSSIIDKSYGRLKDNLILKGIVAADGIELINQQFQNGFGENNIGTRIILRLDPNPGLNTPYVRKTGDQMTGNLTFSNSSGARILAGQNSAAQPSFSFLSDPDTGIFRPANNNIGFSTNGIERLRINQNGDIISSSTGELRLPAGTTAQRPTSPGNGTIRYNTTTNSLEGFINGAWSNILNYVNTPSVGDVLTWSPGGATWVSSSLLVGSKVFIVPNIPARNALTGVNIGDMCFVQSSFDGEWAFFLCINNSPITWIEFANFDSKESDSNTAQINVNFNSASPLLIANVSNNTRVSWVLVEVIVPFNGTSPTMEIGDNGVNNRLMDNSLINLSVPGVYVSNPTYFYTGLTTDENIFCYFNSSGSTQGFARVTISWM
ncbi:MAG: hypothetical protein NZZ41_04100 [Candidatus Dojkabacteria bacterium]|nr:hypothetical protein [Candidatus Dojkabacteria bacterium]